MGGGGRGAPGAAAVPRGSGVGRGIFRRLFGGGQSSVAVGAAAVTVAGAGGAAVGVAVSAAVGAGGGGGRVPLSCATVPLHE